MSLLFLQWMPWLLRMSRPGVKITKKSIMMAKKMQELEQKECGSKSILSKVLDMDDDYRGSGSGPPAPTSLHSGKAGYVNLVARVPTSK